MGPKLRLCRERDPNTMRYRERTPQRLVPLASLWSARVPGGFRPSFSNGLAGIAEMGLDSRGSFQTRRTTMIG
jgi:hypothetical protein